MDCLSDDKWLPQREEGYWMIFVVFWADAKIALVNSYPSDALFV